MDEQATVRVIRVTRPDTILIRATSSLLQSAVSVYIVLAGLTCGEDAPAAIIDWVEVHADAERLKLVTFDWVRDSHGRLLGDLADIQSGETLSAYLLEMGVAQENPHHFFDVISSMLTSREPD